MISNRISKKRNLTFYTRLASPIRNLWGRKEFIQGSTIDIIIIKQRLAEILHHEKINIRFNQKLTN